MMAVEVARNPAVVSIPAKLVVGSTELEAHVKDLTTHGLAAVISGSLLNPQLRRALAAGAWVHTEIALDGRPMVLSGRVFWSNASHSADARILVEMESLDGAALRLVSAWSEERQAALHQV